MNQEKEAFTLIELIIVVVIIGILALVAIPKYFANVAKAQKSQVLANLDRIRQAALAYYAVYGVYPTSYTWPITVSIDGEMVLNMSDPDPARTTWYYYLSTGSGNCVRTSSRVAVAQKPANSSCYYALCTEGEGYANDYICSQ
jgi:prepilin-type N-terminal cleavage/methylation domain-containing protein